MVQRKLPTKLTLQSDHAKAQSFLHHHDLKSPRGADLKAKKMKKSGSIKRPKHPGKPPSTPPLCKTTPNYMKSTTSSDARKEQLRQKSGTSSSLGKPAARALTRNPSFKSARAAAARKCNPVAVVCESVDAKRATCSSTLKDCKFPAFLSLNPEGTSAVKVCPYTYCSLNGHHHPSLPPLKTFMSARRRAVKTQRRAPTVEDDDDTNKRSITREESNDFFLEIYAAGLMNEKEERVCDDASSKQNQEVFVEEGRKEESASNIVNFYEQDSDGSDMEWEIGYGLPLQFDYDYGSSNEKHVEPDPEADAVNFKDFCFDEVLMDEEASQESLDEEGFSSDAFSSSDDGDSTCLFDDMQNIKTSSPLKASMEEEEEDEKKNILFEYKSPRTDSEINNQEFDDQNHEDLPPKGAEAVEQCILSKARGRNGAEAEKEDIALLRFAGSSKRAVKDDDDELGAFNPRAPNFLPLEADPEAERVDLRHQDLEERKNSEEWMVDYALRKVLGPARKRKVALLVEAFEKVTPRTKFDLNLIHASAFDQPRQMQACS